MLTLHGVGGAAVRQMTVTVHGTLGAVSGPWTGSGHVSLRGRCPLAFALNSMSFALSGMQLVGVTVSGGGSEMPGVTVSGGGSELAGVTVSGGGCWPACP